MSDEDSAGSDDAESVLDVVRSAIAAVPSSMWLREDHVATRMRQERERRGWSQEKLAREMKRHGFSLSASSISKIENPPLGSTRRAVSLDQAVGLATVFEVPLLQLLSPPGRYGTQAVADLVAGAELAERAEESRAAFDAAVQRVAQEYVNYTDDFGPVLAGEAKRLIDAMGVTDATNAALLDADPQTLDAPARYQLVFIQAVLRTVTTIKPRERGRRKGNS